MHKESDVDDDENSNSNPLSNEKIKLNPITHDNRKIYSKKSIQNNEENLEYYLNSLMKLNSCSFEKSSIKKIEDFIKYFNNFQKQNESMESLTKSFDDYKSKSSMLLITNTPENKENDHTLISIIIQALQIHFKIELRITQIISLIILKEECSLIQVLPGEGKTFICMVFAVYLHLRFNEKIDILTSAENLAEREVSNEFSQAFFKFFNIKVSCVDSKITEPNELQTLFSSDIFYSTSKLIQAHILSDIFFEDGRCNNRGQRITIVDEVDNMFLDKATYLSQISIPTYGMDYLTPLFFYISQSVKKYYLLPDSILCELQKDFFEEDEMTQLYQNLDEERIEEDKKYFKEYLDMLVGGEKVKFNNKGDCAKLACLLNFGFVSQDMNGKFCFESIYVKNQDEICIYLNSNGEAILCLRQEKSKMLLEIEAQYKEVQNRLAVEGSIFIPSCFKSFFESRLIVLIYNAMHSKNLIKDVHYTINNGKLIVIDFQNTGEYQFNLVWSLGIFQFIQIRENLPIEMESLSSISHV